MDYSAYNQQQPQPQQQQQQYSYEYDPSQIQAYDQSYAYQSYYAYNPQYAAAYYPDPNQAQFQYQPESVPVHPPGVNPTAPEPVPPRPALALREYLAVLPQAILGLSRDKRPILE